MPSINDTEQRDDAPEFWRSLEERGGGTPSVQPSDGGWECSLSRRSFLKLAGAQLMLLSLAGCRKPVEKIVPYVAAPENIVPGEPLFYASALTVGGAARGVLVESHEGRPTKIEGNPNHPDSFGATDAVTQALIYQLYDPRRSRRVLHNGMPSSRENFIAALRARLAESRARQGQGLRFLSPPVISPTLAYLRGRLLELYPEAVWHQYSPLHPDLQREALLSMYGRELVPLLRNDRADVVLSIESDFLSEGPGALAYARNFSARRETMPGKMTLARHYAVESSPTMTGAVADHRVILRPSETGPFAAAVLAAVESGGTPPAAELPQEQRRLAGIIARDLLAHRARSLVVAGAGQPVAVQMMACRLNDILGNTGTTVEYLRPFEEAPENNATSLAVLTRELNDGVVNELIVLDGNPVYAAPRDLAFGKAFQKAGFRVSLGLYVDETALLSHWHLPLAHELESWGDLRAFDGTVTVRQPLIRPLYNGITPGWLCLACLEGMPPPYGEAVREHWRRRGGADFEAFWRTTLHDGVMPDSANAPVAVQGRGTLPETRPAAPEGQWELTIRPDPYLLDGSLAENSWLQELPRPLTKLVWGNAALIAPASARALGVENGDVVEITASGGRVEAPVCLLPGQAPMTVTVHLGYGRISAGIASGLGFNAYHLQSLAAPYGNPAVTVRKKGKSATLVTTQHHGALERARHLVIAADLARYRRDPRFVRRIVRPPARAATLYRPWEHLKGEYQWAMSIDLNRCTGCGACTMACQVENNIPAVGKKEVKRNREMHWIRVDRYFRGSPDAPEIYFEPLPCMHCEDAPCELVCPVEATSHSTEGLNEMTYNRCVGTRYCSNNCPYKVRRFNFFNYNKLTAAEMIEKNPDVTVRSRGVMEKCTYCVQRITRARINARRQNRAIRDGEVVPACQQACPTGAIVFGNIRDLASKVAARKGNPLDYGLLVEIGTRPRTTYLARIRNPNPAMG